MHPDDTSVPPTDALSERQQAILDFERTWWSEAEARDTLIRSRFACSAEEYYRELYQLLDHPAALEHDPLVVSRLRRQRERRRRARIDGPKHTASGTGDPGGKP